MAEVWTVLKVLRWTTEYFSGRGIDGGRLDAEVLLADSLGLDRVGLYLNYDRPLTLEELAGYRAMVARRAKREPVQYILGSTEFWSLTFKVSPAVLIPRADTEVLVEEALEKGANAASVLDVGVGSGAVAVSLATELSGANIEGVDISADAIKLAGENARCHDVADRVALRREDLHQLSGGPYDLIVSNPPYICEGERDALMPEVAQYEPDLALFAGEDGLECYRSLTRQAMSLLNPGGWLIVEVGIGQADEVRALMEQAGLVESFVRKDYASVDRVVGARRP